MSVSDQPNHPHPPEPPSSADGASPADLPRHDFARAGRASLDAQKLQTLHREFAQAISSQWTTQLGWPIEVGFAFIETLTYDDFLHSLGETSCMSIVRIEPIGAQFCVDLSLGVALSIVDRLLGAAARDGQSAAREDEPSGRALTQIEQGLILPVMESIFAALSDTWTPLGEIKLREESLESQPTSMRIMPSDERVTAIRFDVTSAGTTGRMSLCLPAPITEWLCNPDAMPMAIPTRTARQSQRQDMARNLLDAAVELRAVLARTRLRLSEALSLHEGDIVTTNQSASTSAEVRLEVQGQERFTARPGQLDGARAVAITHPGANARPSNPDLGSRS